MKVLGTIWREGGKSVDPRKIRQRFVLGCKDSERNLGLLAVTLIDLGIEFVLVEINVRRYGIFRNGEI